MSHAKTFSNPTHDNELARADGVRQSAVRASAATQAAATAADIVYYQACLASAKAQGLQQCEFIKALRDLGATGL